MARSGFERADFTLPTPKDCGEVSKSGVGEEGKDLALEM